MMENFVALPVELQNAITALSVLIVGWVFVQIGTRIPVFEKWFGQYVDEIAFAISGAVIATLQELLNKIPAQWDSVGNIVLSLLVAVLAALGLFRVLGRAGVKTFRS